MAHKVQKLLKKILARFEDIEDIKLKVLPSSQNYLVTYITNKNIKMILEDYFWQSSTNTLEVDLGCKKAIESPSAPLRGSVSISSISFEMRYSIAASRLSTLRATWCMDAPFFDINFEIGESSSVAFKNSSLPAPVSYISVITPWSLTSSSPRCSRPNKPENISLIPSKLSTAIPTCSMPVILNGFFDIRHCLSLNIILKCFGYFYIYELSNRQ